MKKTTRQYLVMVTMSLTTFVVAYVQGGTMLANAFFGGMIYGDGCHEAGGVANTCDPSECTVPGGTGTVKSKCNSHYGMNENKHKIYCNCGGGGLPYPTPGVGTAIITGSGNSTISNNDLLQSIGISIKE